MAKRSVLVVFDMDGVLVDVSSSYREVVRLSVAAYLRAVLGADSLPGEIITLADVDEIKKIGGYGNDWDLTCAIIDLLLRRYFDAPNGHLAGQGTPADRARRSSEDGEKLRLIRSLQKSFETRSLVTGVRVKSVCSLYAEDREARSGLESPQDVGRLDSAEKSPFLYNEGDVGTGNLVKRIFQELYLGPVLFEEIYGMRTIFDREISGRGRAFIDRERLIPSTAHLVELESLGGLAVATGRPRVEAVYPLRKFGIAHLFKAVVSEDDIAEAEKALGRPLRKPDPFSVALAIERSGAGPGHAETPAYGAKSAGVAPSTGVTAPGCAVFYIGDMPGDIEAGLRAGARPVGFVASGGSVGTETGAQGTARHRDLLLRAGADAVFSDYDELVKYLKNAV
jgi:phosphoglycolate phosphatase-like HAD superfamily hydrolase